MRAVNRRKRVVVAFSSKSTQSYFKASNRVSKQYRTGVATPSRTIKYFSFYGQSLPLFYAILSWQKDPMTIVFLSLFDQLLSLKDRKSQVDTFNLFSYVSLNHWVIIKTLYQQSYKLLYVKYLQTINISFSIFIIP